MPTTETDARLSVSADGTDGPYVAVTPDQFGAVVVALREDGIRFHVDDEVALVNGTSGLVVIDLGMGADVKRVQRVLDRIVAETPGRREDMRSNSRRPTK